MKEKNSVIKIMPEPNVHGLFPTPVLFAKFHRDWTKEEKEFFEETAKTTTQNTGNTTSADRYVLDHDVMKEIREYYQFYLNYYMEKIYAPKYNSNNNMLTATTTCKSNDSMLTTTTTTTC